MTALLFVLGTICGVVASTSSFSLLYMGPSSHNSISSSPLLLEAVPSAQHVADIICRLNGQPPILLEDLVDLPHLDILHGKHAPIVLELHNAGKYFISYRIINRYLRFLFLDLPKEAVSILQIHSNEAGVSAPSLQAVAASLLAHGTPLDSHVAAVGLDHLLSFLGKLTHDLFVDQRYCGSTSVGPSSSDHPPRD